jgi:hypothetical protein
MRIQTEIRGKSSQQAHYKEMRTRTIILKMRLDL